MSMQPKFDDEGHMLPPWLVDDHPADSFFWRQFGAQYGWNFQDWFAVQAREVRDGFLLKYPPRAGWDELDAFIRHRESAER